MNGAVLLVCVFLHVCSHVRSQQGPVVTPIGGSSQNAHTTDEFVISFNITPDVPPSSIYWLFQSQGNEINITENPKVFQSFSADMHSITLNPVVTQHEGVYTLVATSGGQEGSGSVTLNVRSVGFLKHPQDAIEHERQNVTFNCFGTGEPTPTVTWFFRGNQVPSNGSKYSIAPFGDSNFGALSIFNLVYDDHGTYTCEVSNGFRAVNASAVLQVQEFPVIVVGPMDTNTTAGGLARLYCNATGFPIPEIDWFKNNTPIAVLNDARIFATRTEVTESLLAVGTLIIDGPVLAHNGMYSCNASNSLKTYEEVSSLPASLNVQYPPSVMVNATRVTVNQTAPAYFSCEAFGIPPPSLQWFSSLTNTTVQHVDGIVNIMLNSFVNGSNLEIRTSHLFFNSTIRSRDEAEYTCRAENGIGNLIETSQEAVVELVVQVPPMLRFLGSQTSVLGVVHLTATMSFAVDNASPDVTAENTVWQFLKTGGGSTTTTITEDADNRYMFTENRRSLTITNLTHNDEGQYTISVKNPAGSYMFSISLQIEAAPEIVTPPQDSNALQGNTTALTCNATSEPTHTVTWLKNNYAINVTDNAGKYSLSNSSSGRSLSSYLTIHNVTMADTADYTCTVTNIHGTQSATAHLEVQVPPNVLSDPVSIIGIVGERSQLVCEASGSPIPNIEWLIDDQLVANTSRISVLSSVSGLVRTSNVTITDLNFMDTGNYTCRASNNLAVLQSHVSQPALLTVNRPSIIMNTIALPVVNETQNVNMSCIVFGLPEPKVTWSRFDTSNLSTAAMSGSKFAIYTTTSYPPDGGVMVHSTLQVNSVNGTDTGNYTCTSENYAHGTNLPADVDEETFHVLVQTSPVVVNQMSETEIGVLGRNVTLNFGITGDEPRVVPGDTKWYHTSGDVTTEIISGGNSSRFTFSPNRLVLTVANLTLSDQGRYTVNATNIIGMGTSSVFLDVQISPVVNESAPVVRVLLGANAIFQCVAVSEPVHITQWQLNGSDLSNSTKYLINGIDTVKSTLTVVNASLADEGGYTCMVSNVHGVDFAPSQLQVQVPPVVIRQPENTQVLVTQEITLSCQAMGVPRPTIVWLKEGNTITTNNVMVTSQQENLFTTSSILTLTSVSLTDATNYTCMAQNDLAEPLEEESTPAIITVLYPPQAFPLSQTAYIKNESDSFTVECLAFGIPSPTLYWIPGPLNVTLSLPGQNGLLVQSSNVEQLISLSQSFSSRFLNSSNNFCSGIEEAASGSDDNRIGACNQQSQTAPVNGTTTCPMNALCDSVPCGLDISTSTRTHADGRQLSVSRLTICELSKMDEGALTCVADNNISNVIHTPEASSANLIVQVPPLITPVRPAVVAFRDRSTTLDFTIERASPDVAPANIVWTFLPDQGTPVELSTADDSRYQFSLDRRSLNISGLQRNDSGMYTLTATNEAGVRSESIQLIVEALPDIENFVNSKNVTSGQNTQLPCYANGEPLQSVKWEFSFMGQHQFTIEYRVNATGGPIGPRFTSLVLGVNETELENTFSVAGPNRTTRDYGLLTIKNINVFLAGEYKCNLTNIHGSEDRTAQVGVQLFPSAVVNPATGTCTQGGICTLVCSFEGVPAPSIQWSRADGEVFSGGVVTITNTSSYTQTNTTLTINPVGVENASRYHCNASNVLVESTSNVSQQAEVTVHYPASVTSGLQNLVRNESFSAYFTCMVIGIPQPIVTWAKATSLHGNFTILTNSSKTVISTNTEVVQFNQHMITTTLEVRDLVKEDDEAYYRCSSVNNVENLIQAEHESTANLTVQVRPVVTAVSAAPYHLRNSTVVVQFALNDRVFPEVQLSNIHWTYTTENGSEILNTSFPASGRYNFSSDLLSLTITNLQVVDDGNYTLWATNEAGISSATYNLTVYVPAKLQVEEGTVVTKNEGEQFNLRCVADGIPRPNIAWSRGGVIIDAGLQLRLSISTSLTVPAFRSDIIGHRGYQWGVYSVLTITGLNAELDNGLYGCLANNIPGRGQTRQETPYTLSVNRVIINYCERDNIDCSGNGECQNLESTFQCVCNRGYTGETCGQEALINTPPTIQVGPVDNVVNLFDPVRLNCMSTGIPPPTVQWFKDDVVLEGRREQTLNFPETKLTDRGYYRCLAKNSEGEVMSDRALLNFNNIVQFSAVLSRPLSELLSSNISEAISLSIDELNSNFGGRPVGEQQFFFVQIKDPSLISNNTQNVSVPIILTILTKNGTTGASVQQPVLQTVRQFGFQIIITGRAEVQLFDRCPEETITLESPDGNPSLGLNITWPETLLGLNVTLPCPCEFNISTSTALIAKRSCMGDFRTTGALWENPARDAPCRFSVTARRLCLLATLGPVDRSIGLDNITRDNSDSITFTETTIATSGADTILPDAMENSIVADRYINIVDNLLGVNISELQISQDTSNSSGRLNAGLNTVVQAINITGRLNINRTHFTIMLEDVNPMEFNANDFNNDNITLPQSLLSGTTQSAPGEKFRIAQSVFDNPGLYLPQDIGLRHVASSVLDFTVYNQTIRNLTEPLNLTLSQMDVDGVNRSTIQEILCAFWDPTLNDGRGNWNTNGCRRINSTNTSDPRIICQCDHLTSFAVLLDVAPRPPMGVLDQILLVYSIAGCVVSIVCLIVTAFTYLASPKLRQSEASQLLLNLSFGLLGLYVIFIVATQGTKVTEPGCAVVGFFVHYFLLVVFFAMGAEAVDLFMKLVIVLGPKIEKFTIKTIVVSWIAPLFIVLFCFAPNYKHYIADFYCGPKLEPFYFGVIIPFGAIYIFNFTIFTVIMISLIRKQRKNRLNEAKTKGRGSDTKQQFRIAITIAVLFGLGWIFGLLGTQSLPVYINTPFQIVFTTLVGFQGLFIFLLYVVFSPNARKEWKRWILRKEGHRKGRPEFSSTSGAYTSRSKQTKTSAVSAKSSRANINRYRGGGTLYHNVHSSSNLPSSGAIMSIADEFTSYEPTALSGQEAAIEELKKSVEKNQHELDQTFMNPLDGDTYSMKSEMDETQSLVHETTFILPAPQSQDSQYSQEDENGEYPSQLDTTNETETPHTTFVNPFAADMSDEAAILLPSQESSDYYSTPANNGGFSINMDVSQGFMDASQGYTEDASQSDNLLPNEGTKL